MCPSTSFQGCTFHYPIWKKHFINTLYQTVLIHLTSKKFPKLKTLRLVKIRKVVLNPLKRIHITLLKGSRFSSGLTKKQEKPSEGKSRQTMFEEKLEKIPQIKSLGLGPLFKSSLPIELTELETEYFVQCIKHVYPSHIVLQFDCNNTLNDQILENISMEVESPEGL